MSFGRFSVPVLALFVSAPAFAQEAPTEGPAEVAPSPDEQPTAEADPEAAVGTLPEAESPVPPPTKLNPIGVMRSALRRYTLGEGSEALADIRHAVGECGTPSQGRCTAREMGALYIAAGIILASDPNQYAAGVSSFRRGLAYDPVLAVPETYRSEQVVRAFQEAKTGSAPPAPTSQPAQSTPQPMASTAPFFEDTGEEPQPGAYIFLSASPMLGFGTGAASGPALFRGTTALSILGAPGRSRVLVGVRPHFGFNHAESEAEGFVGASFVVGGMLGQPKDGDFSFITMGTGFEHYPSGDIAVSTSQLRIGRKTGPVSISFASDLIWIPGAHFVFVGGEIGFGGGT